MARSTRRAPQRPSRRDRHGRGLRSSVAGPHLPPLRTRRDVFDMAVAAAVDYLREAWPEEMRTVRVDVAGMPSYRPNPIGLARWQVDPARNRVILYRLPIERLCALHKNDEWHRRSYIESVTVRAVAELLGKDPWELPAERFRHF